MHFLTFALEILPITLAVNFQYCRPGDRHHQNVQLKTQQMFQYMKFQKIARPLVALALDTAGLQHYHDLDFKHIITWLWQEILQQRGRTQVPNLAIKNANSIGGYSTSSGTWYIAHTKRWTSSLDCNLVPLWYTHFTKICIVFLLSEVLWYGEKFDR